LANIRASYGNILDFGIVCLEPYPNPRTPTLHHFHIVLHCKKGKRFDCQSPHTLDHLGNVHGDYKPIPYKPRNVPSSEWDTSKVWIKVRYCGKTDPEPLVYPNGWDWKHYVRTHELQQDGKLDTVGRHIIENCEKTDCLESLKSDFPGFFLTRLKQMKELQAYALSGIEAKKGNRVRVVYKGQFSIVWLTHLFLSSSPQRVT